MNKREVNIRKNMFLIAFICLFGFSSQAEEKKGEIKTAEIKLNLDWTYAENSAINEGSAVYYTSDNNRRGITVAVNAGHGTKGGEKKKTLCHPDGSKKLTGGTTNKGSTVSSAISSGMTFLDSASESEINLRVGESLRDKLLKDGFDCLMLRNASDVQLDNVARTVISNNKADIHIAIHFDSTEKDKGAFYIGVPDGLKTMYPVSSVWEKHERLGKMIIEGLRESDVKIFSKGTMALDLTQTSYSTIPSCDIELGDKKTGHTDEDIERFSDGILKGIRLYYGIE